MSFMNLVYLMKLVIMFLSILMILVIFVILVLIRLLRLLTHRLPVAMAVILLQVIRLLLILLLLSLSLVVYSRLFIYINPRARARLRACACVNAIPGLGTRKFSDEARSPLTELARVIAKGCLAVRLNPDSLSATKVRADLYIYSNPLQALTELCCFLYFPLLCQTL